MFGFGVVLSLVLALSASAYAQDSYVEIKKADAKTVTLIDPFHKPEGRDYTVGVSEKSNADGVCKRYGFGKSVSVESIASEDDFLAVIDETGEVSEYYGHDNPELNRRVRQITCEQLVRSPAKKRR